MICKIVIIFSTIIYLLPFSLYAHGVMGKVDNGGIAVTAQYDTGEAMSYARVKISAPGAKLPFQSGRTDRNGRFCFFPDVMGDWKVAVNDEMGHRLEVNIPVDEAMKLKTDSAAGKPKNSLSRYEKALIGIGIIFGVSGFFFWWLGIRCRKRSSEAFKPVR